MDRLPSKDVSQSIKRPQSANLVESGESERGGMERQLTDIPFETFGPDVSTIYAHWQDTACLTHGAVINMNFVLTLSNIRVSHT